MGFGVKWCKWIESCLHSATMSILVNGSPTEEFRLGRGVRHGDPLSPFLFVLAAEGLNAIVNEAVDKGIFRGVRIGLKVLKSVHELRSLFIINSTIYEVGVTDRDNNAMARWMKCGVGGFPFTYLGLPIGENMRRVGAWNPVIDKFKKRLAEIDGAGEGKVCDRFLRLYHLDSSKEGRVADKGRWVDSEWRWEWEWEWVREIRGRVCKEFDDLMNLLQNVLIHNDCRDQWRWTLREDGVFTVKDLTKMVEEISLRIENGGQETLWNKWVPKKVNIFVWRALKGRILVREELDRRGIDLDTTLCPCCDSVAESCVHSLVLCNFAMSVWKKIFNWWKLGNVNAFSIGEIFAANGNVDILSIHLIFGKR
ncbi:reverse transcriptase domain, reverse transcriptase zinc-binding domain protein [Tanacetum coccineum]